MVFRSRDRLAISELSARRRHGSPLGGGCDDSVSAPRREFVEPDRRGKPIGAVADDSGVVPREAMWWFAGAALAAIAVILGLVASESLWAVIWAVFAVLFLLPGVRTSGARGRDEPEGLMGDARTRGSRRYSTRAPRFLAFPRLSKLARPHATAPSAAAMAGTVAPPAAARPAPRSERTAKSR